MTTAESTTPTTPRLSEAARHLVVPDGIKTSVFPRVYRRLKAVDVVFDPWQEGFGTVALGCRASGKYAATIGGVVASIPRQVGKTYTIGNLLIGLALEFPGMRIVWTSHHLRTTTNTFRSMQGMVRKRKIAPLLAANGIRVANGEQEIRFSNGSIIMFGARSQGFGRGMDAIDIEVFDEAQILSIKALEDMVPATNQARHRHGALIFFIGTPPRPDDDGEAFTAKRAKALSGTATDMVYVEFSAERGASIDDRTQWPVMNPSYPHRTPLDSMLRMRENLPDEGSWRREAMGIWDERDSTPPVIAPGDWAATAVADPPGPDGIKSFGVKFSADGSRVAVVGAMKPRDGGPVHVELVGAHTGSMAAGTASLTAWLGERWRQTATIVVDGPSHAGAFVTMLREAGVPEKVITVPTWPQVATANAMLLESIVRREVTHLDSEGQSVLDDSVSASTKKLHGDKGAWSWLAMTEPGDEIPIAAASIALYGAKTTKRDPARKQSVSF